MDRTEDRVTNGYRLGVLGDLNGWIANRVRASITGAICVRGEDENEKRVVEFCAEKGLCVGNIL